MEFLFVVLVCLVLSCCAGIYHTQFSPQAREKKSKKEVAHKLAEHQAEETRKQQEEKEKQRNNTVNEMNNGTWEFPKTELLLRCQKAGINSCEGEFVRKKIEAIALDILNEHNAPSTVIHNYLSKATTYYKEALQNAEAEEQMRRNSIFTATVSPYEQHFIDQSITTKDLTGTDKRRILLSKKVDAAAERVALAQKRVDALTNAQYSPILEKKKDWATRGGLAQGIAGPAAGVAVAVSTMQENEKIDQRNRQVLSTAINLNEALEKERKDRELGLLKARQEYEQLCEELKQTPQKIVLTEVTAQDICGIFDIQAIKTVRKPSANNYLFSQIQLYQKNRLKIEVPNGVQLVIDGTIHGLVYAIRGSQKEFVGDIFYPLEIYGMEYSHIPGDFTNYLDISSYCNRYHGDENAEYIVEFSNQQNLWIMEK